MPSRLITIAIHTFEHANAMRAMLEKEGIEVTLQNVNLEHPEVSSGMRVRIHESDLPKALRIIENPELFTQAEHSTAHYIMVPTDFSAHAGNAARVALHIAAKHGVPLTFFHSYLDPRTNGNLQLSDALSYDLKDSFDRRQLAAKANRHMQNFTSEIKKSMQTGELPAVSYRHTVVEGVPEDAIVEFAKNNPPYLVVMGTRNHARKEKEMIGSVTAEVLDEGRFTVLTIPENHAQTAILNPTNILFLSNLDQDDILAMDTLYRFFPDAKASVTIVHVPQKRRFTDRTAGRSALALSDYCSRKFEHYKFVAVPVDAKHAIDELSQLEYANKFDLIVVPGRRKSALSRLFNPGLAHSILFRADIPMLVIPV